MARRVNGARGPRAVWCVVACAAIVFSAAAQRSKLESTGLSQSTIAGIEQRIQDVMDEHGIPGLSVAVGVDGRVAWTRGFGLADVENRVPATEHTVYRLASISKPITAVAAMQLAEAGALDLDKPVQDYVTGFPVKRWPLTSRQLLGHLGGIRHYKGGEIRSAVHYRSLASALVIFRDDPLLFEPGTRYRYTTYGYNLLGCVVEKAAGDEFGDYIGARIFEPAGMTATRVDDAHAIIPHRAQGYRKQGERLANSVMVDTSNKIPGGGLCGTASDLVRFAIAVRTGVLLKAETRDAMWTPMATADGKSTRYGYGWGCREQDGERVIAHSGAQPRVSTQLLLVPGREVEVALMSNLEGVRLFKLASEIAFALPRN